MQLQPTAAQDMTLYARPQRFDTHCSCAARQPVCRRLTFQLSCRMRADSARASEPPQPQHLRQPPQTTAKPTWARSCACSAAAAAAAPEQQQQQLQPQPAQQAPSSSSSSSSSLMGTSRGSQRRSRSKPRSSLLRPGAAFPSAWSGKYFGLWTALDADCLQSMCPQHEFT